MTTSPIARTAAIASSTRSHTTVSGTQQTGVVKQRRRVELVHGALDRARRVHDAHAAILDPVEGVDSIDQLLERAAGNDPGEDGVGVENGDLFAASGSSDRLAGGSKTRPHVA